MRERKIAEREGEGKGGSLILNTLVRVYGQEIQLAILEMTRKPTYTPEDRGCP
jgi:hypothetical protein